MLLGEMDAVVQAGHTCIALDTPGFGFSDALPGATLTVPELAAATAAAMRALSLPPCAVYGTHTGAAIALELGLGFPAQVSGLVIEGLPMFTQAEIDALFEGYFAPFEPDPLGAHLFETWMRFRDQFTWFPWTARHVSRLNPVDRPTAGEIDHWVSMYFRGAATYRPAYRAACHYGPLATAAVTRLGLPAVFMASSEDMLFPHLDRLPPLAHDQHILRLSPDRPAKLRAIAAAAAAQAADPGFVFRPPSALAGADPALQFIDAPDGQVLLRAYGSAEQPALVLLHDAPGSGALQLALARELASSFRVLLPDLPGNGESAAPAAARSALDAGADAVQVILDHARIDACIVAGIGCGGAVAARLAQRRDVRVRRLVLIDPPSPDESVAQAIAPALSSSSEGAHWLQAWMRVRDGQISEPWFDGRIAAQRATQGNFDAQWLHDQTCALMSARSSFHRLPQEAWRFDSAAAVASAGVPVLLTRGQQAAAFIRNISQPLGESA